MLNNFKGKAAVHVEWVKAWGQCLAELQVMMIVVVMVAVVTMMVMTMVVAVVMIMVIMVKITLIAIDVISGLCQAVPHNGAGLGKSRRRCHHGGQATQ